MKKLSDYSGEKALDVLADLIEPVAEIMSDKEVAEAFKGNAKKTQAIKAAIKNHKKAVITILAVLDGENPEAYSVNLFTLPLQLLAILNDPELTSFFSLQGQMGDAKSSGSV